MKQSLLIAVIFFFTLGGTYILSGGDEKRIIANVGSHGEIEDCKNLREDSSREICLFELGLLFFERRDSIAMKRLILSVQERPYNLLLKRLVIRPHMFQFLARNEDRKNRSLEYQAGILAREDFEESKGICLKILDSNFQQECLFLATLQMVENLSLEVEHRIELAKRECSKLSDKNWLSECYFSVADQLAVEEPQETERIIESCDLSNQFVNYGCFNHVIYQMVDYKAPIEYCMALENAYLKGVYKTLNQKEVIECFATGRAVFIASSLIEVLKADKISNIFKVARDVCEENGFWRDFKLLTHRSVQKFNHHCAEIVLRLTYPFIESSPETMLQNCLKAHAFDNTKCYQFSFMAVSSELAHRDTLEGRLEYAIDLCKSALKDKGDQLKCIKKATQHFMN